MEESKSSEQPRCPCGFWGSPNTLGLCSQCYKAHIEKSNEALQSTADHMISPETARQMKQNSHNHSIEESPQPCSSKDNVGASVNTDPNVKSQEIKLSTSVTTDNDVTSVECDKSHNSNGEKDCHDSSKQNNSRVDSTTDSTADDSSKETSSPDKRGVKRSMTDLEGESTPESSPEKGAGQKNKKRCFQCKCKLELAQRQIGRCRCDYVFCSLHRLPELHNCIFDHKEDGRREAREKMVKPTRHLGTSFKRLDSDS